MTVTSDKHLHLSDAAEAARNGSKVQILCPSHSDSSPSLSVELGADNRVLLHCFAGCTPEAILDAANMQWSDLFDEADDTRVDEEVWTPAGPASHVYPYVNEAGQTEYEVLRVPQPGGSKTFRQRHSDATSGRYVWNTDGCTRIPYRLPQLVAAVKDGTTIYVVEGEKDVHSLVNGGLVATTNVAGAGKWLEEYNRYFNGSNVVVIADADAVGRAHARSVRDNLMSVGATVEIREPAAPHKDVSAHLGAGLDLDRTLLVVPANEDERVKYGVDLLDIVQRTISSTEFVIPNVLARRERLLVTGLEGHGKSTFLRQIAVQVAAGIHPFSLARIEPKKVLYIDAENEPGQTLQSWQDLMGLAAYHADGVERGMLTVLEEWDNSDLDLADGDGMAWLHERIHAYEPDLLLLGPITNLVGRDLKDDEPVRRLKRAINSARTINGCAVIMEHHAPHRNPSDKRRSVRPYGSSMFLKWPDYGYGMAPTDDKGVYAWERTRWPRVRTRAWPEALRWGTPGTSDFPWVECVLPS